MFDLNGRTALITGSSRGIGKAILLSMARQGARVVMHCRKKSEAAQNTLRELAETGAEALAVYADLGDVYGADALYTQLDGMGVDIDILVLNASVQIKREWTGITDEEYELQMNTNLRSSIKLMQLYVPRMREKRWGRVITIGSVQQKKPHEAMLIYSASKSALCNVVLSLATQLAPDGITVNNIAPGVIETDRNVEALSDEAYAEHIRSIIPAGYIGQPEDVAGLAVYLASDESRYMTGQDIYIDGGKGL